MILYIPMKPMPKERPRFNKNGAKGRYAYTPTKTKMYEKALAVYAFKIKEMKEGKVSLNILFCFKPPESWSEKKKTLAIEGKLDHTYKPDLDNLIKSVKDSLNGIAYKDDSQVNHISARKIYSNNDSIQLEIN